MKDNLPSKKIIAFAIIALGFVGAIFLWKYLKENPDFFLFSFIKKEKVELKDLSYTTDTLKEKDLGNLDSDKDGLPDWEELLWGTDSGKVDSDGDKISDGEEVKNGRNPTKAGPDDLLSDFPKNEDAQNVPEKPSTASDIFSENLFSKFLQLKSSGGLEDQATKDALVQNLSKEAMSVFSYTSYPPQGLTLSEKGEEAIKFYASSFATLHLDFLLKIAGAGKQIKEEKDVEILAKVYSDYAKTLYELKVPVEIFSEHLAIVNNISVVSSVFSALSKYKEDPITALSALQAYKIAQNDQVESLRKIAVFLRENDIIFVTGEVGNFWNNF